MFKNKLNILRKREPIYNRVPFYIWGGILKITSLNKQKNNEERYNVFIDNEFSFSADIEDIIKNSLEVNTIMDETNLEALIEECEYTKAYKYSLNLLERKDYTSSGIRSKLKTKSFSDSTINNILQKLKDIGFINDNKFSSRYINDSLSFKRDGARKIAYNLKNKGISQDEINLIEIDPEIEYNNAYYLAEKKYKVLNNKINVKEKIFRYLVNKGYEFELSKKVINEILRNNE